MSSNHKIWAKEPLLYRGKIPVFSNTNDYTDNYEQISEDHLGHFKQYGENPFINEQIWQESEASTIELIKKYSRPHDKILDVGVGMGRVLSNFPDLERYGVDISHGYLEVALSKNIDVCYSLVEDLPYKTGTFDIVLCTDVLEHVLDLNLACSKILSVLKPEGALIVRVPYRENLESYLKDSPYKYAHVRGFDEHSLRLLFEKIFSCTVIETVFSGFFPDPLRLKTYLPIPKIGGVIRRITGLVRRIAPITYRRLLRKFFYPFEINVVVRKP